MTMCTPTRRIEVSRVVNAPAPKVFAFVTRPDNHLALDTSGMIRGSADHRTVTAAGNVFVMNMHNEIKGDHQVENHVICYEPGRAIGWAPAEPGRDPAGHTWTWRLTPKRQDQTLVTEIYDWSSFRNVEMLDHLPVIDRAQMQASLDRLAEALEG
jgi:uncharacterized protein YndB with AHSA1/START domain